MLVGTPWRAIRFRRNRRAHRPLTFCRALKNAHVPAHRKAGSPRHRLGPPKRACPTMLALLSLAQQAHRALTVCRALNNVLVPDRGSAGSPPHRLGGPKRACPTMPALLGLAYHFDKSETTTAEMRNNGRNKRTWLLQRALCENLQQAYSRVRL